MEEEKKLNKNKLKKGLKLKNKHSKSYFPNKLVRIAGPEVNPPGIARHQFLKHCLS
jgi:hypothetical protein